MASVWDEIRNLFFEDPRNVRQENNARLRQIQEEMDRRRGTTSKYKSQGPNLFSRIQDSFGNAAGGLLDRLRAAQEQQTMRNPLTELLKQLEAPVGVDTGSLRGQIDPIFDARIAALENMLSRQEQKTTAGREDVEGSYEALAKDYERLAPEAAAQAEETQQQIEQLYGTLSADIEGNYARIAKEQGDLFKQLGIEDAAPDVLDPQSEMTTEALNRADELSAINQQRYVDIGDIDESYYRQGAPLARLQGTNRSTDLLEQLMDFQTQIGSEIGMAEAERTASFNQLLSQAQNQARQQEISNTRMLLDLLNMQQGEQPEIPPSQMFLSQLPSSLQQEVTGITRSLERSPEVVLDRVKDPRAANPDTFTSVTDEWWLDQVDKMFEEGQLSERSRQALLNYLRLYLSER